MELIGGSLWLTPASASLRLRRTAKSMWSRTSCTALQRTTGSLGRRAEAAALVKSGVLPCRTKSLGSTRAMTSAPPAKASSPLSTTANRRLPASSPSPSPVLLQNLRSASKSRSMSSDADYAAFLEKSNKDYSGGEVSAASSEPARTLSDAPASIKSLGERFYTSETDEPFGHIEFGWAGEILPDAEQLSGLVQADSASISELEPSKWAGGQYTDVVDAVAAAGSGEAKVYRVERSGTRIEYYVLAAAEKKLVGVMVEAVES